MPLTKKKNVSVKDEGGMLFQLSLGTAIVCSLGLIIAAALISIGLQHRFSRKDSISGPAKSSEVPAWGQLVVRDIGLEQPEEYTAYEANTNVVETWIFENMTPTAAQRVMESDGLASSDIQRLAAAQRIRVQDSNTVVYPDADLIFSISPEVRAKFYQTLRRSGLNRLMVYPFLFPKRLAETWFGDGKISEKSRHLLEKTFYPRGDSLCFSDLPMVLSQLPDDSERLRVVQALSHQSALMLRIYIWPDTDLDKLMGYWALPSGVRLLNLRPLLESMQRQTNGGSVSILYFLPPFARQRLYTFPLPSQNGDPIIDCHWTTMNFFNETPDNRFTDPSYTVAYLESHYYKIARPTAYGDLIFLLNDKGEAIHSGVYLADDIVFTKNGNNFAQPWMLMHLKDLLDEYTTDHAPQMAVYRNKKW